MQGAFVGRRPVFGDNARWIVIAKVCELPGDLEARTGCLIEHYNYHRYHESLKNLTPADVYFGRGQEILNERGRTKRQTLERRLLLHCKNAA
jgi:putative transposase